LGIGLRQLRVGLRVSVITCRDGIESVPGRFVWDGGFGTSWASDPKEELCAILLTQRGLSPHVIRLYGFRTSTHQAIDDRIAVRRDARRLDRYVPGEPPRRRHRAPLAINTGGTMIKKIGIAIGSIVAVSAGAATKPDTSRFNAPPPSMRRRADLPFINDLRTASAVGRRTRSATRR
jgi:hypothetical protein